MAMRGGTVRDYLRSIREVGTVAGATEHTYRAALTTFLTKAADELGFGAIAVRSELRLASVGQPDLQVVDAAGSAIGYGETKTPGTAARFANVLESEQVTRYRATLENLLVTDFLRITLFRPEVGRLDVVLSDSTSKLATGEYAVSAATLAHLSQILSAFFSATAPAATSAEMLAGGLARRATLLRDAIRELLKRANLEPGLVTRLKEAYGAAPSVEQIAWVVFGVLSAPAYRSRFAAELAIDHPRIPFPEAHDAFAAMATLGERLGQAHLLEAPIPADVRFIGEGTNRVEAIRHDVAGSAVRINGTQQFTGVSTEAWAWGGSFRPLEHFLTDRKERDLDVDQIRMFLRAITAVRTAIELGPALDMTLDAIVTDTLGFPEPNARLGLE